MNYAAWSAADIALATKRRLILRDHNFVPHPRTSNWIQPVCGVNPILQPYDDFSTEGMTYNSHFFIRIATFEMTCVALPFCV